MRAGELDRRVTVEFRTKGTSSSGEPTETWGSAEAIWAGVRPLSGREYYSALAAQVVAEETLIFRLRWRSDVRPGNARIKYDAGDGERIYNIRRVAEIGRREGLDVQADTAEA